MPAYYERWKKLGVLCLEMESAALYMEAARCGKQALALFTISDEILTGKELDSEARQLSFRGMMELALELS
jgi:purine-nucleoside phosphorylase